MAVIARAIHEHCAVSILRAHRLARGLTLHEAARELNLLGQARAEAPRADADQLGRWETGRQPRAATLALLCELYGASAADLGLLKAGPAIVLRGREAQRAVEVAAGAAGDPLEWDVDAVRRSVDRTLATGSVGPAQLAVLEEQVFRARQRYVYTPPRQMISVLCEHLVEVEAMAAHRQCAAVQVRLSELMAILATLVADALMKLGQLSRSQSWYHTARIAADDSGTAELKARVRVQAAMLPFYYGPVEEAVRLARQARAILHGRPVRTTAFAAVAEARALAKLRDSRAAAGALRDALSAFDDSREEHAAETDAFAFPERRFRLYESGTLTALGRTSEARRVQEMALRLYPGRTGIDPALLHFEAALCLVKEGSPTDACELAAATFLGIAAEHRTLIVQQRAREILAALPPGAQWGRPARELKEILAPAPGSA
ncbi:helix-turn-helix transcriptional regulator [Streptomyces sp. TLI_146]|uniref:helix-turn-helix domain-containing protein n=1 Tax=Streptomyces sp. TLI_146 TaxID=1938858 RepID=UPI00214CE5E0|nr:helix-turn-helix transcriptional regulator [Streptomyces sp. TLI_146]